MNKPIGIYDSGTGGLTVAKAIAEALPQESFIYFGDTAHLPYGDKSKESIELYSKRISDFLVGKGCKLIIIACNTASAHAFSTLEKRHPSIPIVNVVDPTVKYCATHKNYEKIGVIATKGTVTSRIYPRKIKKIDPNLKVVQNATPLLAPMIEEGFFNNSISQTIINSYLSAKNFKNINALILACTHYPLIKKEVESFFNNSVSVIDSASVVADVTKNILIKKGLQTSSKKTNRLFYVSDYTKAFEKTAKLFFGEKISLKEERIWD